MKRIFFFLVILGFSQSGLAGFGGLKNTKPDQIYVFGDSFADTGNQREVLGFFPIDPPYFDGRISNGPVFIEGVAAALGREVNASLRFGEFETATNFSQAGSPIDSTACPEFINCLRFQVDFFINDTIPRFGIDTSRLLFVLIGGGNDTLQIPCDISLDPCKSSTSAIRAQAIISAQNLGEQVEKLHATGAKEFFVLNYPGFIDENVFQFTPNPVPEIALEFATFFNAALAIELDKIRYKKRHINIIEFDTFKFFREILITPEKFGITNITEPCVTYKPLDFPFFEIISVCDNPKEYFLFDSAHPTSTVHALWAKEALRSLLPKHNLRKRIRLWIKWKRKWKQWKNSQISH